MNARFRCLVSFAAIALLFSASPVLRAADGSVQFDGVDDYIDAPYFHLIGVGKVVTIEFWAQADEVRQQAAFMLNPDDPANRCMGSISYSNGNTYWDYGDIADGGRLSVANPPGTVGNWTHYAFVASTDTEVMKIYVNGVEVASKTGSFQEFAGNLTPYDLLIGGGAGFRFKGKIDEFRVWNVARTPWQIQRDRGATLTGSEAGLRLYYRFDEDSGNSATNSATATGSNFNGSLLNGTTRSGPARLTVSTTNDSGTGSLRQAVADAAAAAGASYITFHPALSGQTITLNTSIFVSDATGPVTIDASSLPGGLTLDGSGGVTAHEIFSSSTDLSLYGLTLTGAKSVGIISYNNLTLTRCTLFGNSSSSHGGAIYLGGDGFPFPTKLTHCTLSGNASNGSGGAIYSIYSTLELTHCTFTGNTAAQVGGGIRADYVTLTNCIVAGNTDGTDGTATDNISSVFTGSNNLTSGDPLLSPLGYYGGSTMTMRPLPGSPAIDAGFVIPGLSTDQRGFARNVDGNGAGGAQPDIGAVELNPVTVTTAVDELTTPSSGGAGISLREAVRSPADIFFAPALNGQTIRLTLGTEIVLNQSVTIDASSLPAGLTVDGIAGSVANRLFTVSPGQSVSMSGLTLTGGVGEGAILSGYGGAIMNQGTLTLHRCTLSGNQTGLIGNGGAILINLNGLLRAVQCTFYGNAAAEAGGAIMATFSSRAELVHCTVSANSCFNGNGGGVASNSGSLRVSYSIVSGNSLSGPGSGIDVGATSGTVTWAGANYVGGFAQSVTTVNGPAPFTANPLLGLLGDYGGPARTMLPKAGSPVINAAVGSTVTADQRGFAVTGSYPDVGAAERRGNIDILTVTTTADELDSPNNARTSLREAITDGAATNIIFAPALSGGTITLTRSPAEIAISQGVTVDATSLPKGLTIHGGTGVNRILNVTSPAPVVLKGLTFTSGDVGSGAGGAIFTAAGTDLMIEQCTLTGNTALEGGAVFSLGTLVARLSTFSGNTGNYGGALQCQGETTINRCTISGNQGPTACGGIFNKFTTPAKPLLIGDSIIAGNTSPWPDGDDIYTQSGVIWMLNANIVVSRHQDGNSSVRSGSTTPLTSNPLLAPLQNYGGPTQTMALKPGSPALNAAPQSNTTTDQRGFPLVGTAWDIGAYEAGTIRTYNSWTWERQGLNLLPHLDNDNDGLTNLQEYGHDTDPRVATPTPLGPPTRNIDGGGGGSFAASFSQEVGESEAAAAPPPTVLSYDFSFRYNPEATDLRYIFQRSSDLSPTGWTDIYTYDSTTGLVTETIGVSGDEVPGSSFIFITDEAFDPARTFWRLVVEQPTP